MFLPKRNQGSLMYESVGQAVFCEEVNGGKKRQRVYEGELSSTCATRKEGHFKCSAVTPKTDHFRPNRAAILSSISHKFSVADHVI